MSEPTLCARALSCPDLLLRPLQPPRRPLDGFHVLKVADRRGYPWPSRRGPGRRALLRPTGPADLAQMDLAVRRAQVLDQGVSLDGPNYTMV